MQININLASKVEVDSIVEIHKDAFKNFFLTSLGTDFLKFYYSCFIASQDGFILCAFSKGQVVGFAALANRSKGFNSRLIKKNFYSFGILSLKMLFSSPRALLRLVKNLTKKSHELYDLENCAELFSIGVSSKVQGKGIGKQLLLASESYIKREGISGLSLTTDYYNNESAVNFYKAMNYRVICDFVAYPSRRMYRFIKDL